MNVPIKDLNNIAIFCDFDGTLVRIAPTPSEVHLSPRAQQTITTLSQGCDNAFAVVSGRPLAEIKQFLTLEPFNGAGCHGAELEYNGEHQVVAAENAEFEKVKQELRSFAEQRQLIWEDKGHSFAIHVRLKPEFETELDAFIDDTLSRHPALKKLFGKAVREVKPGNFDKGSAIEQMMKLPVFAARTPYYFGDDVTDEDAFAYINSTGGVSVKIGPGETCATYRLESPESVVDFFELLLKEHP